jgi:hypothetical protein
VAWHLPLESSWQGLQLCLKPHFNQRSAHKVIGLQSRKSLNLGNPDLGVLKQNDIWVLAPWPNINNIRRGKVMASPKSEPWWVLWVRVCLWFIHAPKMSRYALTNLMFGLCRSKRIIDLFVNPHKFHFEVLTWPFTPKVLWTRECAPTFFPSIVITFGLTIESIKELGGASHGIKALVELDPPIGEF